MMTAGTAGVDSPQQILSFDTWLGRLLVAGTEQGICSILILPAGGGSEADLAPASLALDVAGRLPAFPGSPLAAWAGALAEYLAGHCPEPALPLVLRGTPFQQSVWQALRAIPPGQTRTYTQLAQMVGHPGAVRAVGQACAANTLAVLVPCHRAVRADGSLGGFRWGLERKQALLEWEAQNAARPPVEPGGG